jgi:glutamate racemase
MPYGNYSAETNTPFLRELILRDTLFLLGARRNAGVGDAQVFNDKPPVKAIVIACNTATAYGLEDVRRMLSELKLPHVVVGVVEAGARGVLEAPEDGAVGIFATVGTCASGAYPRAIQTARGQAGRAPAEISQFGSSALAGVIEGDPAFAQSLETQVATDVRAMVEAHRASGAKQPLAKVVLGCTHFPLAQRDIDQALEQLRQDSAYAPFIAAKRTYVNPAEWTARELFRELAKGKLRRPAAPDADAKDRFFLSVPNPAWPGVKLTAAGALEHAYKYGRRPGNLTREDTLNVPTRPGELPEVAQKLVRNRLPTTWARLSR